MFAASLLLFRPLCAIAAILLIVRCETAAKGEGLPERKIVLTRVDADAAGYGTFQSHNQKVVANANGTFMTWLHFCDPDNEKANVWRLAQRKDGETSFTTIYEATISTRAPALETDAENNLYVVHPVMDAPDRRMLFYRFMAEDGYTSPRITIIPNAPCAAKFSMTYDAPRAQFYIGTQYGQLIRIGRDGVVRSNVQLIDNANAPHASTQYPHLRMDARGRLHHAWTTSARDRYLYWDIHHMLSADGGESWQNLDGTPIAIPPPADDTGPTLRITLDDEFHAQTWLASMLPKSDSHGEKLHFFYAANPAASETTATLAQGRMHYVRYDMQSGRREIDSWEKGRGSDEGSWGPVSMRLAAMDGFFATDPDAPESPLIAVMLTTDSHIGALISRDNGTTWHAYARSEAALMGVYSLGGSARLGPRGEVVGSFTTNLPDGHSEVYALRIEGD